MIYIISDIHGRKDRFDDILKQIHFSCSDTMYILGDVIDRNPDGIELLKYIIDTPNIKMLLGNHEYMMLNALKSDEHVLLWYRNGGEVTHQRWKRQRIATRTKILEYLYACPLMVDLEMNGRRYRLVHGKSPSEEELSCKSLKELTRDIVWGRVKLSSPMAVFMNLPFTR